MYGIIRIIGLVLLIVPANIFANCSPKSNSVNFKGKINGDFRLLKKIRVAYFRNESDCLIGYNGKEVECIPGNDGRFEFNIDSVRQVAKIAQFVIYFENDAQVLNNYVIASSDKVNIEFNVSGDTTLSNVRFFGKGSEKYNCRYLIEKKFEDYNNRLLAFHKPLEESLYNIENLVREFNIHSDGERQMMNALYLYKNKMPAIAFSMMEADIIARVQTLWQLNIRLFYEKMPDKDNKIKVLDFYQMHNQKEKLYSDEVMALSWNYVDYIYRKINVHLSMINDT
ncbi:MAG: hypothetical protein J7497_10335, partial [Chitinophagaceae bacterium]|nr:hypothetical protein [Chitinophagaceae bacterium]